MPASLQAKLLSSAGGDGRGDPRWDRRGEKKVDVRIVAATNANLASQIAAGAFRQDLYFRLAQYEVELPSIASELNLIFHCLRAISCGCLPLKWDHSSPI